MFPDDWGAEAPGEVRCLRSGRMRRAGNITRARKKDRVSAEECASARVPAFNISRGANISISEPPPPPTHRPQSVGRGRLPAGGGGIGGRITIGPPEEQYVPVSGRKRYGR